MTYFICQSEFEISRDTLFGFHESKDGFDTLVNQAPGVVVLQKPNSLMIGETAILLVSIFKIKWIAKHIAYVKNELFIDKQISGPFLEFEHSHIFKEISKDKSKLIDQIKLDFYLWPISKWFILPILKKQFKNRHQATAKFLNTKSKLMFCGYSISVID
ncbi:MAG: hypothetical protein SH817_13735 [Leptospira sp.]|nr:hypothetical protein [Leptospira sp.]